MRRTTALLAGMAFLGTACISQDDPSLTVQAMSTDVAFGVEVPEPAGEPVAAPAEPLPATASDGGFEPPAIRPRGDLGSSDFGSPPGLPSLPVTPPQECPSAPPTAAAEEPASENVLRTPTEGVYRWKREGKQSIITAAGQPVEVAIGGFEKRIVRNVVETGETSFTFDVVRPLLNRSAVSITTYGVETEPTQYQPGGVPVIDAPRGNEPEGGLTLKKIVIQEEDGSETSFNPSVGLLYIGLPVVPSERFTSSAVDGRSGQSIVHEAKVLGRDRIDACGDLVDGWRVEATQNRTDAAGEVSFDYLVAPQLGGLLIREEIEQTDFDGNTIQVTYTLAQLEPDPLPEDEDDE